jgi:hypothetical protein
MDRRKSKPLNRRAQTREDYLRMFRLLPVKRRRDGRLVQPNAETRSVIGWAMGSAQSLSDCWRVNSALLPAQGRSQPLQREPGGALHAAQLARGRGVAVAVAVCAAMAARRQWAVALDPPAMIVTVRDGWRDFGHCQSACCDRANFRGATTASDSSL